MSYRMHIAIVNTQKAQPIRVTTGEYFNQIISDWPKVQELLCAACKDAWDTGHFGPDILKPLEEELKQNNLAYSKKILTERFWEMSDGPFDVTNTNIDIIRNNITRFQVMVEEEMGVIEDYVIGRLEVPQDIGYSFFVDESAQQLFADYNPRILRKADMEAMIESWRKLVVKHYKEILMDPTKQLRWQGHIEAKIDRWEFPGSEPYNVDDNSREIVKAYDIEYRIFELVRLYKSIDWMRDTVILYGW